MSRVRILATLSLALSLALAPASSLAQPAPSAPDPEQSPAPAPDAAAGAAADPSVSAPSPSPTPATPPPPPAAEPPTAEPPGVAEPAHSPVRFSGYNSLNLGFPTGSITSSAPLRNMASGAFQLEAGPDLVIARRVILGFNLSVGVIALGDEFDASCRAQSVSCRGAIFDAGAHLEFLLMPAGSPAVPWIGFEAGYELFAVSESDGPRSYDVSYLGNQFEIRAGVDLHLREQGGWGPFIAYQRGKYTSVDISSSDGTVAGRMDLANQSEHGWLLVGLRGRL
jgi:hypothetical protein